MLVLTRKINSSLRVGEATITILEIQPGFRTVRLGIEAPSHVRIVRDNAKKQTRHGGKNERQADA